MHIGPTLSIVSHLVKKKVQVYNKSIKKIELVMGDSFLSARAKKILYMHVKRDVYKKVCDNQTLVRSSSFVSMI